MNKSAFGFQLTADGNGFLITDFQTYHLAIAFYRLASTLKLQRHLRDQLLRAASSIVLNLAEGAGRHTKNDQGRFFVIAFGSLRECQAILDISLTSDSSLLESLDKLAAHVYSERPDT